MVGLFYCHAVMDILVAKESCLIFLDEAYNVQLSRKLDKKFFLADDQKA